MTNELVDVFTKIYNLSYRKASFRDYLCNASDYLKGTINGVKVRIYISNGSIDNVRRSDSVLLRYNDKRRVARIFFEYVLYKFSRAVRGAKTQEEKNSKIEKFMKFKCSVQDGFEYTLNSITLQVPMFDAFDKVFENGKGRIAFSSKDLFVRVMYNINQLAKRKWSKVEDVGKRTIMETYFENISDFNASSDGNFFIVHGLNTFMLLLSGARQGEVQLNSLEPFDGPRFFSSDDIENGRVFSAFCFGSMEDAINFQVNDHDSDKKTPGIIYIFDLVNGYEVFQVQGDQLNGIKLLVFKVDDGTYYLALKELVS
jgi:hypothetical protein